VQRSLALAARTGRGATAQAIVVLGVGVRSADQYWVAYEGNDLPEDVGETRVAFHGGGQRSLEDGTFVLDTRASTGICDWYEMPLTGVPTGPDEFFVLEWRMRVDQLIGRQDSTISVRAADGWIAGFRINPTLVQSSFAPELTAPLAPDVFHSFRVVSPDMRIYTLSVDGADAFAGSFFQGVSPCERVAWGDTVEGGASLARWDYVSFGVVPEPTTASVLLTILSLRALARARGS
jgi:hypothetical protein